MKKDEKKEEEKVVDVKSNEETDNSNIEISNDVVAIIAGMAASDVPGVAEMAGGFAGGISEVLSGKRNKAKGIKVDIDGKKAIIDVNIIVEYGTRIPDVAFEIQKRVKKAVENMTGFTTTEVNVHVQGVLTAKEANSKKSESKNEESEDKKETKETKEKKELKDKESTEKKNTTKSNTAKKSTSKSKK